MEALGAESARYWAELEMEDQGSFGALGGWKVGTELGLVHVCT